MFDIGWSELLVIAVVAIVVVGPKELPKLMRSFGFYAGKLRRAAAEFRRQFDEAMREAELEEVKQAIESVRTEARSLNENAPLDRPLMGEGPATKPAPAKAEAKPAAKAPRNRATSTHKKAKTQAKPAAKRAKRAAGPEP